MGEISRERQKKAVQMLLLGTMAWGISFPVMKAAGLLMQRAVPEASTWFHSSLALAIRFLAAGVLLIVWNWRSLKNLTKLEIYQGAGLGLFGGFGIIFQMDGLAYTEASTSAFLTQGYVLLIPWIVALRDRRAPRWNVLLSSALMILGAAALTGMTLRKLHLGRGEIETLIGSLLFTGQILWLERPIFARNDTQRFSAVMFIVTGLVAAPVAVLTMGRIDNIALALGSPVLWMFLGILVFACTLVAYMLMNHWQRYVGANRAGIIYGAEPIFALLFALFLPGWFSGLAGLSYENESLTTRVLVGGALIVAAIVLVQLNVQRRPPRD